MSNIIIKSGLALKKRENGTTIYVRGIQTGPEQFLITEQIATLQIGLDRPGSAPWQFLGTITNGGLTVNYWWHDSVYVKAWVNPIQAEVLRVETIDIGFQSIGQGTYFAWQSYGLTDEWAGQTDHYYQRRIIVENDPAKPRGLRKASELDYVTWAWNEANLAGWTNSEFNDMLVRVFPLIEKNAKLVRVNISQLEIRHTKGFTHLVIGTSLPGWGAPDEGPNYVDDFNLNYETGIVSVEGYPAYEPADTFR